MPRTLHMLEAALSKPPLPSPNVPHRSPQGARAGTFLSFPGLPAPSQPFNSPPRPCARRSSLPRGGSSRAGLVEGRGGREQMGSGKPRDRRPAERDANEPNESGERAAVVSVARPMRSRVARCCCCCCWRLGVFQWQPHPGEGLARPSRGGRGGGRRPGPRPPLPSSLPRRGRRRRKWDTRLLQKDGKGRGEASLCGQRAKEGSPWQRWRHLRCRCLTVEPRPRTWAPGREEGGGMAPSCTHLPCSQLPKCAQTPPTPPGRSSSHGTNPTGTCSISCMDSQGTDRVFID